MYEKSHVLYYMKDMHILYANVWLLDVSISNVSALSKASSQAKVLSGFTFIYL